MLPISEFGPAFAASFGVVAIFLSYYFGFIPAVASGLLISIWGLLRGRPSLLVVALCGFLVYVVFSIGVKFSFTDSMPHVGRLLVFMIPTMVCWSLAQAFWNDTP
jgi:hypothetical protein